MYLPMTDEPGEVTKEVLPARDTAAGAETILVLDDEREIRKLLKRILQRNGYEVLEAADCDDAFQICEEFSDPIHLLVTDVVMPKMNGREVADTLLQARPGLRVLFRSGYSEETIAHHGVLDEDIDFISKPFSMGAFVSKVREILDRRDKSITRIAHRVKAG